MTWILPVFEIIITGWLAPVFWAVFVGSLVFKIMRCHHV